MCVNLSLVWLVPKGSCCWGFQLPGDVETCPGCFLCLVAVVQPNSWNLIALSSRFPLWQCWQWMSHLNLIAAKWLKHYRCILAPGCTLNKISVAPQIVPRIHLGFQARALKYWKENRMEPAPPQERINLHPFLCLVTDPGLRSREESLQGCSQQTIDHFFLEKLVPLPQSPNRPAGVFLPTPCPLSFCSWPCFGGDGVFSHTSSVEKKIFHPLFSLFPFPITTVGVYVDYWIILVLDKSGSVCHAAQHTLFRFAYLRVLAPV